MTAEENSAAVSRDGYPGTPHWSSVSYISLSLR